MQVGFDDILTGKGAFLEQRNILIVTKYGIIYFKNM